MGGQGEEGQGNGEHSPLDSLSSLAPDQTPRLGYRYDEVMISLEKMTWFSLSWCADACGPQSKGAGEEKKPVDLEKEWARTAAAKQTGPPSSRSSAGSSGASAAAEEKLPLRGGSGRPKSPPAKEAPSPASQPASGGYFPSPVTLNCLVNQRAHDAKCEADVP